MARSEPGEGIIGDLILLITGNDERLGETSEHLDTIHIIDRIDGTLIAKAGQSGALLIHQGVGRDMLGMEVDDALDRLQELGEVLSREAEHEVEADVVEMMAEEIGGADGVGGSVSTADGTEGVIIEALYAHADARDAGITPSHYPIGGDILRVHLDGKLAGIGSEVEEPLREALKLRDGDERGGAAADIQ